MEVSPRLHNEDLAPAKERNWGTYSLFAMITSVLAVVVLPWFIFQSAWAVNHFLGGLGAVLGPLLGIIIADFYLLRKRRVDVAELYKEDGAFSYRRGWNPVALKAFVPAAVVSVVIALVSFFHDVAAFSWFVGSGLGAVLYLSLSRRPEDAPANRFAREEVEELAEVA